MFYENELRFLRETFRKCHIQTHIVDPHAPLNDTMDHGLRRLLGREGEYVGSLYEWTGVAKDRTIYRVADSYFCNYLFFRLPDAAGERVLLLGPYLTEEITSERLLERAEILGIPPRKLPEWEQFYGGMPHQSETDFLFVMLDTFAERLWGADNFTVVDIAELSEEELPVFSETVPTESDDMAWRMRMMEERYAYENDMIRAVEHGQIHKSETFFKPVSALPFERRLADPLRNLKNYCIIMNTLLRKAAERGGVHPVYLDETSSAFARKIESLPSTVLGQELMQEMFRSYCRLVRKQSMKHYSPPVQKAITCIAADLTADLSLHALAAMQNISAGYLSALFRQETGQTLTEYVNQKRVALAKQLLTTTKLQVQTVAQHCGILDIHYFSRLFKKHTGKTPKEYRETQR